MKFEETYLKGCFVIDPTVFEDSRGYFFESFHLEKFKSAIGQSIDFIQDNESLSKYGVVRGLHFQRGEWGQAKLVRAQWGTILDVAVDIRPDSDTFGRYFSIELSAKNKKQLFVPEGFMHGFSVLSDEAIVQYKCSRLYNKESEAGIYPLDKSLAIDWQIPREEMIISEKDRNALPFSEIQSFLK